MSSASFYAWKAKFGKTPSTELIHLQTTSTSSTFDQVVGLLKGQAPPTALIAQGTNTLLSVLNAIAAAGRRIPNDTSIISIGDPDFASTHVPPIAALKVSTDVFVERTAELLMERSKGDRAASPQRAVVQFEFKSGNPAQRCTAPDSYCDFKQIWRRQIYDSASSARSRFCRAGDCSNSVPEVAARATRRLAWRAPP